MDPIQAAMAGIFIAREIIQLINSGQAISEEQLSVLIASNLIKLDTTVATIKGEMAKFGVEVK